MPAAFDGATLAAHPAVRLLQTIYLPEDEVCFYLLESDSLEQVRRASADAGLPVELIHQVCTSDHGLPCTASLTNEQALALARAPRSRRRA